MQASSESDESSSATHSRTHRRPFRGQADWERARKKLVLLRERLYRRRLLLKEKREEIREEESCIDGLFAKFFDSTNHSLHAIQEVYTKIEVKRNELGALQHDYDHAEEDYDVAEAELEGQEAIEAEKIAHYSQAIAAQGRAAIKEAQLRLQAGQESGNSEWQPRHSLNHASSSLPIHQSRRPTTMSEYSDTPETANGTSWVRSQVEKDFVVEQNKGRRASDADGTADLYIQMGSSRAEDFDPLLSIPNKIGGSSHQSESIRRRSRMNRWLFDTFGSSSEDFLQRAGDKKEFSHSKDVDNVTWGRIVHGYWFRKPVQLATPATPQGTRAAAGIHERPRHRDESIDGSQLHLRSVSSNIKPSIDDVDRLFSLPSIAPYSSATSQMNDDIICQMFDELDSCLGGDDDKVDRADSII